MNMKIIKNKNFLILCLFCLLYLSIFQFCIRDYYFSYFNNKRNNNQDFSYPETLENGFVTPELKDIFWFIQITDTQFLWSKQNGIDIFNKFLNETNKIIKPLFIINTGDIVDADNGRHQNIEEWQKYNKTLTENKINSSIYVDLVGNHDGSEDPQYGYFINYSITGSEYKTTQISFNHSFSFGNYAFIGINTAKDLYENLLDFAFVGYLNTKELDWYENELKKYKDYDNIFVFGHHPPFFPPYNQIISNLSSTGKTFSDLNKEYHVNYYFCGHIHSNYIQKKDGLTSIMTDNFDENNGTYRIVVIDNNQLSSSVEQIEKWPQGIIIYPPDREFYNSKFEIDLNEIHALAWDPEGINSVEWSVYFENGKLFKNWTSLQRNHENDFLWEGDFCRDLSHENIYIVKVRIEGNSGQIIKEIVYSIPMIINFELIHLILIIFIIGIVCIPIIIIIFYTKKTLKKKLNFKENIKRLYKGISN
jgi:3',5'-cyclic AMP phosphodiesterase CpdA/uncharacterized membrane protein YciS (DUF1049 family)